MDENAERRPHRPLITTDAVLFAIQMGAKCPHTLAAVFDVHILNPDLIHACNDLATLRVIEAVPARRHTAGEGFTCTPIVVVPSCMRDDL
jgi:hypothetical protein